MSRVLVVEDEDMQRTAFVRALSKLEECCVIGVATVGAEVVAIDAHRPDVIVSDIGLPDRLGVELLKELAARSLEVPILFVTADVPTYRALVPPERLLMEKPVPLATLREVIRGLLAQVAQVAPHETTRLVG
jgi:DNA-binding NarL/FixJ family response regulator